MIKPRLIVFDCDGVLVDSEKIENVVIRDLLASLGLILSLADIAREFSGTSDHYLRTEIERRLGRALPVDFTNACHAQAQIKLDKELRAVRGVSEVVRKVAAAGIPMCVASNGPVVKMMMTLGRVGLLQYFGGIFKKCVNSQAVYPLSEQHGLEAQERR